MKFYINRYPIIICFNYNQGEEHDTIPEGTAFTISCISQQSYTLKPVKEIKRDKNQAIPMLDFTPEILKSAFSEVDYLPE